MSIIKKSPSKYVHSTGCLLYTSPGQTLEYKVTGEEQAIVLQQGDMTCWVEYEGVTVVDGAKGQRGNVYDDLPTALYVPPKATVKLYSEKGLSLIHILPPTSVAAHQLVGCRLADESAIH